ncbi:hypothetical protein GSI_08523 [Ganoderma sinense ZZ0214-1]|uniref:Uncharacterized protein n=1 Tax=Ganoderma sinense ZZ0214-1 TaxID=1077348 RepID=A0A2G8S417_9APHY|nr:hypothetical protein GSI_08523 [Ganoderma sinense ZZ0214-1]
MDKILEGQLLLGGSSRPTPKRNESQDHVNRAQRPPMISLQLSMGSRAKVGQWLFYPARKHRCRDDMAKMLEHV